MPLQCLLGSCDADISLKKHSADTWGLTGFAAGRISEKERPHPVYVCFCRSVLSSSRRCNTNSSGHNSTVHLLHSGHPTSGRTEPQDHAPVLTTAILTSVKLWHSHNLSTQITLKHPHKDILEEHQGRYSMGSKQCRGTQTYCTEGSDPGRFASCHLLPRFARPK